MVIFMIIIIVYVISIFIYDVLVMILYLKLDLECDFMFMLGMIYYIFFWMVFLNNVFNFFIYGLLDDRFFLLVKELFQKKDFGYLRLILSKGRLNLNRSFMLFSMFSVDFEYLGFFFWNNFFISEENLLFDRL